jgi:puromycin-sensitive aminopeptidase
MENFGALTFREGRLLVHPVLTSPAERLLTARVVCHEVAHQWFGAPRRAGHIGRAA